MNSALLSASSMNLGVGLVVAAVAIGVTVRVALLLRQGKQVFPRQ